MIRVLHGDCRDVMQTLDEASIDSIVCDPPYELGFMGKGWDCTGIANDPEVWAEALRVLKPGGHLLAFSGTRTYHRMVCAIEDAGFEIRDQIGWLYGSGFPKSLDVSKAIDKRGGTVAGFVDFRDDVIQAMDRRGLKRKDLQAALGNHMISHYLTAGCQPAVPNWRDYMVIRDFCGLGEKWDTAFQQEAAREVVGTNANVLRAQASQGGTVTFGGAGSADVTAPATDGARQWQGWGTALKPAWEPIVVARKPLISTVSANVLQFGTGAINVDGCRVSTDENLNGGTYGGSDASETSPGWRMANASREFVQPPGRWPANIIHDGSEEVLAAFPQTTDSKSGGVAGWQKGGYVGGKYEPIARTGYDDTGSAARFFKECKWDCQSNDHPASGAASLSGSCETPTVGTHVARPIHPDRESPPTPGSTNDCRSSTPIRSPAPAGLSDSTDTTPTTATRCESSGPVPPAIGASTSSERKEAAAVGIDQGSATRFWYSAKANGSDRNDGGQRVTGADRNHHPTVKPTDLMRYLCRLVTPPGGTVLDPFMGSGSTLKAAELEGFSAIGIELDPTYVAIARRRIASDAPLFAEVA